MKRILLFLICFSLPCFGSDLPTDEQGHQVVLQSGVRIVKGDPVIRINLGPLKKKFKERVDKLTPNEGESDADYRARQKRLFKVLCAEAAKDWLNVYVRKVNGKIDEESQEAQVKATQYQAIQDQSDDAGFPVFEKPANETVPVE